MVPGASLYTRGVNKWSDLTQAEWEAAHLTGLQRLGASEVRTQYSSGEVVFIPSSRRCPVPGRRPGRRLASCRTPWTGGRRTLSPRSRTRAPAAPAGCGGDDRRTVLHSLMSVHEGVRGDGADRVVHGDLQRGAGGAVHAADDLLHAQPPHLRRHRRLHGLHRPARLHLHPALRSRHRG